MRSLVFDAATYLFVALGAVLSVVPGAQALDDVTLITDFGYNGRHAYFFVAIEKGLSLIHI